MPISPDLSRGPTFSQVLAGRAELPPQEALSLLQRVAAQVAGWHRAGGMHLQIGPAALVRGADGAIGLAEPAESCRLGADPAAWESLPVELRPLLPFELATDLRTARDQLRAAGRSLDPRQIDLHALGALLCLLLTGESPGAYLRSPRVKQRVPGALRGLLERCLGAGGTAPFADAGELAQALSSVVSAAQTLADPVAVSTPVANSKADTTPSFVATAQGPPDTSVAGVSGVSPRAIDDALPFDRLGHYEIVSRIGRGGMGDVYLAYERSLDRQVAIKVLPAELARNGDFVRRFRAEATAAARLIHPNIIQIFFIGEDAGHHYFAMQFIAGESLAELLHRTGRLSADETIAIAEQALSGLAAAHRQGMVHRDIKPGNILLDRENRRALLADFGLVKSLEASVSGRTATGMIMGTVDYIAPEQARGLAVDARSDLYSLGVLIFQLLSGRLPFEGDSPTALIFQHVYEAPPELGTLAPGIPPALGSIVCKLLAKSADDRHQTAEEVLADLRALRAGEPLPSGADRAAAGDAAGGMKSARSTIIYLPQFEESDPAPETWDNPPETGWWGRARDRGLSLFRRHAPGVLDKWQNTQQRVDGAVDVYTRRQRELARLVHEAESVLKELRIQAEAQREAARLAQRRGADPSDKAAAHGAQADEIAARQSALELDQQARVQSEQLDAIRLKLAQVSARQQELAGQRDLLQARLKAAGARARFAGKPAPRPRRTHLKVILAGGCCVLVAIIATAIYRSLSTLEPSPDTRQHELENAERLAGRKAAESARSSAPPPIPNWDSNRTVEKRLTASRDGRLMAAAVYSEFDQRARNPIPPDPLAQTSIWNMVAGAELASLDDPHRSAAMALSADGRFLGSVGTPLNGPVTELRLWNTSKGKLLRKVELPVHTSEIGFSSDGKRVHLLLKEKSDVVLGIVGVESDTIERRRLPLSSGPVNMAAFSPVEESGVFAGMPGRRGQPFLVGVHDFSGRQIGRDLVFPNPARAMLYSSDGRFLAVCMNKNISVYETSGWTQVSTFQLFYDFPSHIAFSQDGRYFAAMGGNKTIEIWNVEKKSQAMHQVSAACLALAFGPPGTLVMAPADARPFVFLNAETAKELLTPTSQNK